MTQPPYAPPHGTPPTGQPHPQAPQGQAYPQAPQGQPGFGAPGQAPQKKPFYKKTWFIVLAVLTAIAVIVSATSGGKTDDAASTGAPEAPAGEAPAAEAPAPEDAGPGIGQPAADGKFNFVVQGVDCSLTRIGNEYFGTDAQGQFCVVDVAVTNIGDEPQSFFGDNAILYNAEGQKFSADTEAAIYLEDSSSIFEEINPGNTLNSKVVFDVPTGTAPSSIELHDSMYSGGVTVALQ